MARNTLLTGTAFLVVALAAGGMAEEPDHITAGDEYDTYSYTAGNGKTYS
ncbi:MAG: hypothetical protein GF331_05045, partial [Chitinivibrionales bacterium]|nr:hypothetical protein [Chitinivibrionales bacterium]